MLGRKERMIRRCSEIEVQNMAGYYIREKDLHVGDIASLLAVGYKVYGVSQTENTPFRIENQVVIKNFIGIAVFRAPILFPKRPMIPSGSPMNYYVMNNQYSYLDPMIIRRDLLAKVNLPRKTLQSVK